MGWELKVGTLSPESMTNTERNCTVSIPCPSFTSVKLDPSVMRPQSELATFTDPQDNYSARKQGEVPKQHQ